MAIGLNKWSADNGKFTLYTTVLILFCSLFLTPVLYAIPSEYLSSDLKEFLMVVVNAAAGFLKGLDKIADFNTATSTPVSETIKQV